MDTQQGTKQLNQINSSPLFIWSLLSFSLLMVTIGWAQHTGPLFFYINYPALPGQTIFIFAKLCGLYGFVMLCFQIVCGLLTAKDKARLSLNKLSTHVSLGLLTVLFLLAHVSLLVLSVSLRGEHFAYKLLLPNFFAGYYIFYISFGVLALWGIIIALSAVRYFKKNRSLFLKFHRFMLLVWLAALLHSFSIGSETKSAFMIIFYVLSILVTLALLLRRVWLYFHK